MKLYILNINRYCEEWYLNEQLHREIGPAKAWRGGYSYWYLNYLRYSEYDYHAELVKRGIKVFNEFLCFKN